MRLRTLLLLYLLLRSMIAEAALYPQMAEPFLSIWEDPTGEVQFPALDDGRFVPANAERMNAGYTASVIWLRLDLKNPSAQRLERYFEIELDTISFFDVFVPGAIQPVLSGGQRRSWNPDHPHRHPVIDVSLEAGARGVWYIRLQNNYSLCLIAWLHSIDSLAAKEAREALIFGCYVGLIVFALILSIYLFITSRHSSFAVFALVLLTYHLGYQLTNFGLAWIHLWPNATVWADKATLIFIELTHISGIFFIRPSLELSKNLPGLNRWLWLPVVKSIVVIVVGLLNMTPGLVAFSVQGTGILLLFYYGIGLYLWNRGYSPARYLSLAWTTIIFFDVLSIMQAADLVRFDDPWFRSAIRFDLILLACSIQAIFLAIAIGDQFQSVQKQREMEGIARRKLEKSIDDAHVVQEAFIRDSVDGSSFEIVTSHHPSAKIGGDWLGYHHDLIHKRLILAISDVTGHGLPAALLTGAIHGAFYGLTRTEEVDRLEGPRLLSMLMQRINEVVCMTAANTSLLATMVILAIDLESGQIEYINAGHTPVVLVRSNHPQYILQGGSPLGLNSQPNFGVGHYQGQSGDTLFLYTDGLLDNAQARRRMQLHHLSRLLKTDDALSAIQNRLEQLAGPNKALLEDDYSYIICRLRAA